MSDDLRRHVEEEVRAAQLRVVTEDDVRRIVARVGEPGAAPGEQGAHNNPVPSSDGGPSGKRVRPGYILLALGVILPLITLIFELVTGMSAGVLFDPLPSLLNVGAVALVPAANFWIWRAGRAGDSRQSRLLGWMNGLATGVCLYYSLIYLPLVPFAAVGILYFGLGLLPLAPHLALMATPWLRRVYVRQTGGGKLPWRWGLVAGFGFLVLLQVPAAITYYGLAQASSEDRAAQIRGVRVLRALGDDDLLLRACYGLLRREGDMDWVRLLVSGNHTVSAEASREIYYRVKGKPFNSVPPPSLYTRMGRWTVLEDEFVWDEGLGGETVAGRVKGLSLLSSRMDAVAEPDASLVYCEWTLEFKNISRQPREARVQLELPPGAVVSRVTLWINGEEREAAFGGRAQVRKAYQEVAVAQRRDPVLVTTSGPDRVLMQCFPVAPNGGIMKVRLGITAPLSLESRERGIFVWPKILERNFGVAPDFKHTLWVESPAPLNQVKGSVSAAANGKRPFTIHQSVADQELADKPCFVTVHRAPETGTVWTPRDESGMLVRQILQPVSNAVPSRFIVVLDGSQGMQSAAGELADALAGIPATSEIALVLAGNEQKEFRIQPKTATPEVLSGIRRELAKARFVGGQDNLPALEAAWELAAAVDQGVVIWVHQPQPVLLSSEAGLRQGVERAAASARLFELQTCNGPDRIIEKLDGLPAVERVVRLGAVRSDLTQLISRLAGARAGFQLVREPVAATAEITNSVRVGRHIERLWARDEAVRLVSQRKREEGVQLAARSQLVTPWTGAVVLETKEQYDRHHLKPADPMSVPAIPEPGALSLILLVTFILGVLRRRR